MEITVLYITSHHATEPHTVDVLLAHTPGSELSESMGFQDVTKSICKELKKSKLYHWSIRHVSETVLTIY